MCARETPNSERLGCRTLNTLDHRHKVGCVVLMYIQSNCSTEIKKYVHQFNPLTGLHVVLRVLIQSLLSYVYTAQHTTGTCPFLLWSFLSYLMSPISSRTFVNSTSFLWPSPITITSTCVRNISWMASHPKNKNIFILILLLTSIKATQKYGDTYGTFACSV